MSEERRKKKQDREGVKEPSPALRKVLVLAAVVLVAVGLFFFLRKKHDNRMDAFAKCLGDKGAKMYGAFWCPHCADQKERFGPSFQFAPYVECGIKGSRATAQVCLDAGIKHYPTWVFADGARVEGDHTLEFLGQETGCPLP